MSRRASDLPLDRDPISRFLPWIIGVMVYLAGLALAGAMVLSTAIGNWSSGLAGTLTVQILPAAEDAKRVGAALDEKVEKALAVLRDSPGVARAEPLAPEHVRELLRPWLGSELTAAGIEGELPMPRLIDVTLTDRAQVDVVDLTRRVREAVPEAQLDDHGRWLEELISLVRSLEAVSAIIVALSAFAAVATVIFATRAGLAVHRNVVEVLHMIGARDSYVARQFQNRALRLGMIGGIGGLLCAAATVLAIGHLAGEVQLFGLPDVSLTPLQWTILAGLAPIGALIAMVTARMTVMRGLARLL